MPSSNERLTIERFSFSVRLNTLFFPFSIEELTPGLEQLGYSLMPDVERMVTPGARPVGSRLRVSGNIAQKADPPLQVRIDMARGILGVDGRNIDQVIGDYRLLENWIGEQLALDLSQEATFYEIILEGLLTVGIERSPIETLKRLYSDAGQLGQFGRIIGRDVTNFGIRLVDKGRAPAGDIWFDLRIEPSVQRSATAYAINAVSRGPQAQVQAEEARQLPGKVTQLVSAMEKGD